MLDLKGRPDHRFHDMTGFLFRIEITVFAPCITESHSHPPIESLTYVSVGASVRDRNMTGFITRDIDRDFLCDPN